jgi:hypothetical protein
MGCVTAYGRAGTPPSVERSRFFPAREDTMEYEIEVQELKDRRRGLGRVAVGALVTCVLALVLHYFI